MATAVHRCELVDHGEAGDDFSAEAQAGTQTAQGQHGHVRGECAEEGEAAKQQQVDLVSHAAALQVTDEAGQQRTDQQTQEACGHKGGILRNGGPVCGQRAGGNGAANIYVDAVHQHASGDQRHDAMEHRGFMCAIHARDNILNLGLIRHGGTCLCAFRSRGIAGNLLFSSSHI